MDAYGSALTGIYQELYDRVWFYPDHASDFRKDEKDVINKWIVILAYNPSPM